MRKTNTKRVRIIIYSVLIVAALTSLNTNLFAEEKKRPRVGVVLSGGGAKGFAHIALLRKLEELKIPVDYIGGTSMGATVAALYAMGYSPDDLESIVRTTDWTGLFMEKSEREDRDMFTKTILQEFPITANITEEILSPKGLVTGNKISAYLSRLTIGYHGYKDFSKFKIPFICIGTDMETGEGAVFREGDIVNSLRASMAIPTIFEPVKINGRIYLDGGIVNNMPVREVKAMGADFIIGVDVGAPLYTAKQMTNFPKIVNQLISFNGMKLDEQQRNACDILIQPDILEFDATSFESTDKIIKAGEVAVEEQSAGLLELAEKFRGFTYVSHDKSVFKEAKKFRVKSIVYDDISPGTEQIARSFCNIEEGQQTTIDEIEKIVKYLYGTNYFNMVSYRLEIEGKETVLHFYFDEKSERRFYAGFSYDNYMKGALYLGIETNRLFLNNARAYLKGRVGKYGKLDGGYNIYTSLNPGFMILANASSYSIEFTDKSSTPVKYEFMHGTGSLGIGAFVSNWFLLTTGVRKDLFSIKMTSSSGQSTDIQFDNIAAYATLKIDTINEYHFPTSGVFFESYYDYVRPDLSFSKDNEYRHRFYHMIQNLRCALPLFDRVTLGFGGSVGVASRDDVPPSYLCAVGGSQYYEKWVFPLEGYAPFELVGQHGWMEYAQLQCRIIDDLYITPKWNTGKTGGALRDVFTVKEKKTGYGVKLGYNFYLGPIEIGVFKKHRKKDYAVYLNLGFVY